jgi:UDP-glucose 4-epimerase
MGVVLKSEPATTGRSALVTGAGGFVGTQVCRELSDRGWRVTAIARATGDLGLNPSSRTDSLRLFCEPEKWRAAMQSVDCVVHLAARVHRIGTDSRIDATFNAVNVDGSRFVAELAASAGVRRFVFLSSVKVNGEGGNRLYRGEDVPAPEDAYGRSKLAAERVIQDICRRSHMELVIIRPPLVYGPGVKANFRRLIWLADLGVPLPLGSIENRRSLIGLNNLVDFMTTCMLHPGAPEEIWLVADDEVVSTPYLLRSIARHLNRPSRLFRVSPAWLRRVAGTLRLQAAMDRLCNSLEIDSTPTRTRLGWSPKYSLDGELARTVIAYRNERQL